MDITALEGTVTLEKKPPQRIGKLEAGLALIVVGVPFAFTPFSANPFLDLKLVCLLVGVLLIAKSDLRVDRRIAFVTAAWMLSVVLASILGVDPWWSLMGDEQRDNGLLLLVTSGMLLVAGTGIPEHLAERLPSWIVGTAAAITVVAIAGRFIVHPANPLTFETGTTFGQPVYLGGFMAAALSAALYLPALRRSLLIPALVLIASGLSLSANRSGLIGAGLGIGITLWRLRAPLARSALVVSTVVVVLFAWALIDEVAPRYRAPVSTVAGSASYKLTEKSVGVALQQRAAAWQASLRAWSRRPVLGWGPGNTWGAFLSSATVDELRIGSPGWSDTHNILVESLITTGAMGALALITLGGLIVLRIPRASPQTGWAAGATVALLPTHLMQPLSVVVMPLFFLLAGIAVGGSSSPTRIGVPRLARGFILVVLAGGVALATIRLGASIFEWHGNAYGSERSLRTSLRLEPLRLSSSHILAMQLASEARLGNPQAATEARRLSERSVRWHAWHRLVRLEAAQIEATLGDDQGAERWLRQQLDRFPNDPLAMAALGAFALKRGDSQTAASLARRSLAIYPTEEAQAVLKEAEEAARR